MALKRSPDRLNSIANAAIAAKLSGDKQKEKFFNESLKLLAANTNMP